MEEYKNFMNDVYDLFCVTDTIDATTISSKKTRKKSSIFGYENCKSAKN